MKKKLIHQLSAAGLALFSLFSGAVFAQTQDQPAPSTLTAAKTATDKVGSISSEYLIGPENALQIDVYYGKGEKISQKVRVSSRGTINFPLVGDVYVEGLTISGLEGQLVWLLGKDYLVNPQVTVYIEEYSTVSIVGEVETPGVYQIKGKLTVVELISLAKGFTKFAASNKVKVIHNKPDGTREETVVRVSDIMNREDGTGDNLVLRPGDVVIVPETRF